MTKKSKYMTGQAFPVNICDAIRHHNGTARALESKRDIAFDERDAAVADLEELDDHDSPEAMKIKALHSDAILAIDTLSKQIRFHNNQVSEMIERPDEPKLDFEYDMPVEPAKPRQMKLGEDAKDARPVGRPPEAPVAVGENQHLTRPLSELADCGAPDWAIQAGVQAGFESIAQLVAALETAEAKHGDEMGHIHGLDMTTEPALAKAVEAYRKKHRKAINDKDLGRGDEPSRNLGKRGPRVGAGAPATQKKPKAKK